MDGRKQPVRGLWKRNERFYAQLTIEDPSTGTKKVKRVPLLEQSTQQPVATVADAIKALERLKVQREDNALPVLKRTPKLSAALYKEIIARNGLAEKILSKAARTLQAKREASNGQRT